MLPLPWISHPDAVDARVAAWQEAHPETLRAESKRQFAGRPVWALTVTDQHVPDDGKVKILFEKPHAHEPAPVAAQMHVVHQLLTGQTLDGRPTDLDRERILRQCLLVFMPDANPQGTASAPVEAWDGSRYTNDEFYAWMRGVDAETGEMWKRVDLWDDSVEAPLPSRYGIVYEQISQHEYVEPNRHHSSTLFQWVFELMRRWPRWDAMLSLHQTEFINSDDNCMVILPCMYDELAPDMQGALCSWADDVIAAWNQVEGAHVREKYAPLSYTGVQRQYFVERWGDIYGRVPVLTSEIRNNSPTTAPHLQQALNEAVIEATIERLLR